MSARQLRAYMWRCIAVLLAYAATYVSTKLLDWNETADIMEALMPVVLGVLAVVLAAAFNRRKTYLDALREVLWQQLIPTIQSTIQYTHRNAPTDDDYTELKKSLSTSIDMLRGVYKNLGESTDNIGLYPYENLKDIDKIVDSLKPRLAANAANDRKQARKAIVRLWQQMHRAILVEFERDVPKQPVTPFVKG